MGVSHSTPSSCGHRPVKKLACDGRVQGAVDRALLGDCANALPMATEADAHPEGLAFGFQTRRQA